jgi:hypothetical protein
LFDIDTSKGPWTWDSQAGVVTAIQGNKKVAIAYTGNAGAKIPANAEGIQCSGGNLDFEYWYY